jgi:3-hydroxy-3-methylglutaryl CoA synthase
MTKGFIRGMGSVLRVFPDFSDILRRREKMQDEFDKILSSYTSINEAIKKDWAEVGKDLCKSIEIFSHQTKISPPTKIYTDFCEHLIKEYEQNKAKEISNIKIKISLRKHPKAYARR